MKNSLMLIAFIFIVFPNTSYGGIAFVANMDGNWDLFYSDEEGKKPVRLTSTAYDEKDPSWSLDGKHIVFATSDGKLNIVSIPEGVVRQLKIGGPDTAKFAPSFSSKGKKIAYVTFKSNEGDDTDLMVYDLDTQKHQNVLDQYGLQLWPVWSPGNGRLLYTSTHCNLECGTLIQELWVADPAGGWARQILMTGAMCRQPAWSPSGKRIAFCSDKSGNFDI